MPKNRRGWTFLAVSGLVGVGLAGWAASASGLTVHDGMALFEAALDFLEKRPLLLFFGIMILPGMAFPLSPLLILGGVVFGAYFGVVGAVLVTQVAVCICMCWNYFAIAYPLRDLVERLVRRSDKPLPDLTGRGAKQVIFLVRAAPGVPFIVQNATLGLLRVPFVPYIIISTLVSICYTTGFVVSGKAVMDGNIALLGAGLVLLIAAGLLIRWLMRRTRNQSPGTADVQRTGSSTGEKGQVSSQAVPKKGERQGEEDQHAGQ